MTVRWGILGCGDIARKAVARAIQADPASELVAACRRDIIKLNEFCKEFDVPLGLTGEADLLAERDIDAVYVATPVHLHKPQTIAAARAGKHVLVEKPMALSVAECDEMIAVCRENNVRLGVAYYRRFYPIVDRMKELLAAGHIGQPLAVRIATSTPFDIAPGEDGYYRAILAEGGGSLMDLGSHRINLLVDLFGMPSEVKALTDTLTADYETEDSATLAMRFPQGPHATMHCLFGTTANVDSFSVIGTTGELTADPLGGERLTVRVEGETTLETHARDPNTHAMLIADFSAAIAENRPPRVSGEEGRAASEVMQRAYAAAEA